ncbi:MAG TPA: GNAT family N-acetyltransferase [Syntrophales bacterium]
MKIVYTFNRQPADSQIDKIICLYQTAGWWTGQAHENTELIRRIVTGSHCFVLACEGNEIIGMGRAISDGISDAYIQDVTVLPEFRGQGVGTGIVQEILKQLRADGLQWIGLIAGRHSHPFYRKMGFEEMPAATAMLLMMNFDGAMRES